VDQIIDNAEPGSNVNLYDREWNDYADEAISFSNEVDM